MEKLYYSIGEVATILSENVSLVRYWTNGFSKYIKLTRTSKGNRQYTKENIETLKQIHYLVKTQGMTLEGAAHQLEAQKGGLSRKVQAIETLKSIRGQLEEIKNNSYLCGLREDNQDNKLL